jgi:stage V sporulation protein R
MELVNQKTKQIMEGCKDRARKAGLSFQDETLEYIVTNRDLIELTPKLMIPTLYDYWVHDVEVLKEKGRYELYPSNPYETVINTRPAISFYNDNNPDWMNVMIFYHVLAHIDFFQNNVFYRNTWDFDFTGQALSDKRLITRLRSEKGRWVDYVIEFARSIDNLVNYSAELSQYNDVFDNSETAIVDFYFDVYLQNVKKVPVMEYVNEMERYNKYVKEFKEQADQKFFDEIRAKVPEFNSLFAKHSKRAVDTEGDLMQYIFSHSEFLKKDHNSWMKSIIEVVRKTSLFFQPQIRTKIMNEGWASYWHEVLFLSDDRIKGHEVDFARTHSGVASLPRVGLNPYALGMRMFQNMESLGDTGKRSLAYLQLQDVEKRKKFDLKENKGKELIFDVRTHYCDAIFIDHFIDQEFVDKYDIFVAGKRLNQERMVWEYYVKSRKAEEYRNMMQDHLYHPPCIEIDKTESGDNTLRLNHRFEGKPLFTEYITNTMMGIEYLWGGPVQLETRDVVVDSQGAKKYGGVSMTEKQDDKQEISWQRVQYTMKDRKLSKKILE